jgi:hypothetical protein
MFSELPTAELPAVRPPAGRRHHWWGWAGWALLLTVAVCVALPVGIRLGIALAAR